MKISNGVWSYGQGDLRPSVEQHFLRGPLTLLAGSLSGLSHIEDVLEPLSYVHCN